jgi:serine/threonine protein kinase
MLRWLFLTVTALESLPAELGKRPALQKLMVAGNRLSTLPKELSACHNLQLLRIAANRFEVLPEWLLSLPCLSWLSYSGNPLCEALEAKALTQTPVLKVSWSALKLGPKLGEGASGVIYRAGLDIAAADFVGTSDTEVAVKLFKGALTSDGLPESEMAACITAGAHPNLIQVLGKLSGHPQGVEGLVMSLVDPTYKNLAGPPSFETCTRDVYASDLRFSVQDVLTIAKGVAGLAAQLHARGLMHGDLYAHNTLLGPDGRALIGDFGAASFVDVADRKTAEALERLEVRAYGCLLEELLERVEVGSAGATATAWQQRLTALKERCSQVSTVDRPDFATMTKELSSLG